MDQIELTLLGQYRSADMLIFLSVRILTRGYAECDHHQHLLHQNQSGDHRESWLAELRG